MLFGDCQEITLDDKGSELLYMPSWCDESDSQHFFDQLLSETNWQQDHIHIYGKKQTLRLDKFVNAIKRTYRANVRASL